jgi:hypothetical protein
LAWLPRKKAGVAHSSAIAQRDATRVAYRIIMENDALKKL